MVLVLSMTIWVAEGIQVEICEEPLGSAGLELGREIRIELRRLGVINILAMIGVMVWVKSSQRNSI